MQGSVKRRRVGYCCDETIQCVRVFVCQCDGRRMNCEKHDDELCSSDLSFTRVFKACLYVSVNTTSSLAVFHLTKLRWHCEV